jgi:hypothetical protein
MRAMSSTRVDLEFHEAANIFPMDDEHLSDLAADIKASGLRIPIELLDGKVIDGRRRLAACALANVAPTFRVVTTLDPVAYVLSLNLHRRHLTPSQLAMVAARARSIYDAQAKARMVEGAAKGGQSKGKENLPDPIPDQQQARDAAGKAVGVSGKTVDFATRVLTKGAPELVKAVDDGRIAVSTAAIIAADPPETQRAFAESATRKYRPVKNGGEFGPSTKREREQEQGASPEPGTDEIRSRGVGVQRGNEAVDCLKRIPRHDPLRARGFQIVTDWIRRNR